jgi:hypothetical protein
LGANKTATATRPAVPPVVVVVGFLAIAGAIGFYILERASKRPAPPPPVLSSDARAYVKNLQLFDVEMKAQESYLKQAVTEITGKIGNNGDRIMQLVEINCVFFDRYGQVVLRERVPIVSRKMGSLAPGEIKSFRLPFDNIPESWSQAMPQMVIANIEFQ